MLFTKKYLYLKYRKRIKFTSGLIRHLNTYTKEVSQIAYLHKFHDDKIDILDENLEDGNQLLDKTNYIIRDTIDLPIKRIPQDELLISKFLSSLRDEWFIGNELPAGIPVSNIKYNHPELKHQNSFYPFNDQFDYVLAHYFAELEITKSNINKFLSDLLMIPLTKKLSYKNANE